MRVTRDDKEVIILFDNTELQDAELFLETIVSYYGEQGCDTSSVEAILETLRRKRLTTYH